MALEASLLRAAEAAGVPVPDVVAAADDLIVVRRLSGETLARRLLRDDTYTKARERLTEQCAQALARVHTKVSPDDVPGLPVEGDPLEGMRLTLDQLGEPHPALELGLLRLARTRPAAVGRTLVHGDFRLGNLMVDSDGLVGVLDWELAHIGDAAEDLGWLCVRSWRFGSKLPVAGVGDRDELRAAYAAAGGADVSAETLAWWEAYGTLRWAVICVQQASTHLSGAVRSVELAVIGRRVCEVELDLLDLLVGPRPIEPDPVTLTGSSGPHDRPTARELLDATREWLAGMDLSGRDRFLARVADRALATVDRELGLGPALAARHHARLAAVG